MLKNDFCVSLHILNCCSSILDALRQLTTVKHGSSDPWKRKTDCWETANQYGGAAQTETHN